MLGDAGAGWVADMLAANSTLQELSLEGNWIGLEGAVEIADALPANSSLSLLHLGDCPDFVPDGDPGPSPAKTYRTPKESTLPDDSDENIHLPPNFGEISHA